jgi:hypothetical protein
MQRLSARDPRAGEDARAAVEWLTASEEDEAPAVFTRRRLQLFLWYELPRKWLLEPGEHLAVAAALAALFDELGDDAAELEALCRSEQTTLLLREGGDGFVEAIEASGLEPPDTPLLEWGDLMTIEESLERDAVSEMLEQAVDARQLDPGARGWQERQRELVERHLITPDAAGAAPLTRIHAARRQAWLERFTDEEQRALVDAATPAVGAVATSAEAEAAIEPLLWLLGRLTDGVKLTQTGALPRALVREAVDRYPDWWDNELFGPPHREADVYALEVLHTLVDELGLARKRRGVLRLGTRGRSLRDDPSALLATVASTIATGAGSAQLDLVLAELLTGNGEPDFRLLHLLGPFHGIIGGRYRKEMGLTPSGRTLAAAILRERAYGPRHNFA